jgi:hypothetical protein
MMDQLDELDQTEQQPAKKRKHGQYRYTTKSMEYLKALGRIPWVVERLIPTGGPFPKKQDLWNLFDLAAVDPSTKRITFVQTTSYALRSAHKKKMLSGEGETTTVLRTLLAMGNVDIDLYGWRKDDHGKWEITVERLVRTADLLSEGMEFVAIEAPTFKEVRAQARAREDAKEGF